MQEESDNLDSPPVARSLDEYDFVSPSENLSNDFKDIQSKMWQIINHSAPLGDQEKGEVILLLNNNGIRSAVTEILNEIQTPKQIHKVECLI